MYYYQNLKECLIYLKYYEEQKAFMQAFYEEMVTGKTPMLIELNPNLTLRYYRFKSEYLKEIATANSLMERQYYLNELLARKEILKEKRETKFQIELKINYEYRGVNNG